MTSLRSPIRDSWRRCYERGLDPSHRMTARPRISAPGGPSSTDERELCEVSLPIIEQAKQLLAGSGTIMAIADAAAIVLASDGDEAAVEAAATIGLSAGMDWSESARGTNGLAAALQAGEPIHVHGPEHFSESLRDWTCSATVICDPIDGTQLGAITISGPNEAFNPHLLPLAVVSAAQLRSALLERETLRRERLLGHALNRYGETANGGLVLFDRRGRLITADARGRQRLTDLGWGTTLSHPSAPESAVRLSALDSRAGFGETAAVDTAAVDTVIFEGEPIGTVIHFPPSRRHIVGRESGLPRYKLKRVLAYIEARISATISLDDLAGEVGMSRFHFHRQFKKAVGTTPRDFIIQKRVERAKELLIRSDMPLVDVARETGFVDQSHFSNTFRKLTSMTPRSFRHAMSG
jgi:sigma-54 dependent transcriptional regulator, acetoin dehydrogenase operon transcriptional activator AcoR